MANIYVNENPVEVRLTGGFSARYNGAEVSETGSRSKKVWELIKYLFASRGDGVTAEMVEYVVAQMHPPGVRKKAGEPRLASKSAMKTLLYRLRAETGILALPEGTELIRTISGGVPAVNPKVFCIVDTEEIFGAAAELSSLDAEAPAKERMRLCNAIIHNYGGDIPGGDWTVPLNANLRAAYIRAVIAAAEILRGLRKYRELLDMTEDCEDKLGVTNAEIHAFREEAELFRTEEANIDSVRQDLLESPGEQHAYLVDFDTFKMMYNLQIKHKERTNIPVHIAILSLRPRFSSQMLRGKPLARVSEQFAGTIASALRAGDVFAPYGNLKFVVMLIQHDDEHRFNPRQTLQRVASRFHTEHLHLSYDVEFDSVKL